MAVEVAKEMIQEAIREKFDVKKFLSSSSSLNFAYFGCTVGPNTFISMHNIVESIKRKHPSETLEFQVFFHDQIGTDWNRLFKSLPPNREYFDAGMPGSVHGRLLAGNSLHFVLISLALHWLSRVPKEVVDKNTPAWNKGKIFYARAMEMAARGLIAAVILCFPENTTFTECCFTAALDLLGSSLVDMAKEVTKMDSFNIPIYTSIVICESGDLGLNCQPATTQDIKKERLTENFRAVWEEFFREHFGSGIVNELFGRFKEKAVQSANLYQPTPQARQEAHMARVKLDIKANESCPMNGGDGPYSYARNSYYQREVVDASKSMIVDAINEKLLLGCFDSIRIVDLGSSAGPNTFVAVQNIIEAVELKYKANTRPSEFQVFFNDLASNDFNTLFVTLPAHRRYFAAGVPGSFHQRLFPRGSVHVAHASHALHWLSRVPEEVVDRNSATWNKGKVYYGGNKKMLEAYSKQFKKDMEGFLSARAEEIVEGGLVLLLLPGYEDGVFPFDASLSMQYDLFGSCFMDMVKMGKVEEEKVDSFNLPMYLTSPGEMRELIEANGCFHIERMESFNPYVLDKLPDFNMLTRHVRASMEGLIREHFGSEIVEELFHRFAKKLAENTHIFDLQYVKEFIIFACLKRKVAN
ncbi:Loganate O-methyltransferase [Bertholletia excelsa]